MQCIVHVDVDAYMHVQVLLYLPLTIHLLIFYKYVFTPTAGRSYYSQLELT